MNYVQMTVVSSSKTVPLNDFAAIQSEVRKRAAMRSNTFMGPCGLISYPTMLASQAHLQNGDHVTMMRYSFMGHAQRIDDLVGKRAIIFHPERHEMILLNLRRNTFEKTAYGTTKPGPVVYTDGYTALIYTERRADAGTVSHGKEQLRKFLVDSSTQARMPNTDPQKAIRQQHSEVLIEPTVLPACVTTSSSGTTPSFDNFFRPAPPANAKMDIFEDGPNLPSGLIVYQATEVHDYALKHHEFITVFRKVYNATAPEDFQVPPNFRNDPHIEDEWNYKM